eukprot:5029665-Alexandrium_andersonii.AAC.1
MPHHCHVVEAAINNHILALPYNSVGWHWRRPRWWNRLLSVCALGTTTVAADCGTAAATAAAGTARTGRRSA